MSTKRPATDQAPAGAKLAKSSDSAGGVVPKKQGAQRMG
jgi:hypothetical protein